MPTAIITGANSGIANSLAQILIKENYKVIAVDVDISGPIKELGCEIFKLDVSSSEGIKDFQANLNNQPIDLLLNVAGVMSPHEADALGTVNNDTLHRTFAVNTFGPLILTQALLPNIRRSSHPRIAVMSSRVGSMGDNSTGGMYAYRASKAAVNAMFKSMSVDLKGENIPVILLHPGIVKTNLDQRWKKQEGEDVPGAVEPGEAARDLWKVLMDKGMESTGRFFHRNGEELPW